MTDLVGSPASGVPFDNAFIAHLDEEGAQTYAQVRPSYPAEAPKLLLHEAFAGTVADLVAVDIGAGTGKFTRFLVEAGVQTIAIDPSAAMRSTLLAQPWAANANLTVLDSTAEDTGLNSHSCNLVVWAQCFHWLDVQAATREAFRILRPNGVAAVVGNQLDVEIPWVHRLSRIMRAGDVLRRDRTPALGPLFSQPSLVEIPWNDPVIPEDLLELATTRSSYLNSSEANRERMQRNLRWYLYEHLGFEVGQSVELPYRTFVWWAKPREV